MIVYIGLNFKIKFTYAISMYVFSTLIMLVFSTLYISHVSTYLFSNGMDNMLYMWLSNMRIHVWEAARLCNIALSVYMLASVLFMHILRPLNPYENILLILPIAVFLIYTDPSISYNIYIFIYSMPDPAAIQSAKNAVAIVNKMFFYMFYLYMLMPLAGLIIHYMKSKIEQKRSYYKELFICLLMIDLFFVGIFFGSSIKYILFKNVSLLKIPNVMQRYVGYIILPASGMAIVSLAFFLTLRYKPFDSFMLIKKKELVQSNKWLVEDLNSMLHIYKNAFLGIQKHTEIVDITDNADRIKNSMKSINKICDSTMMKNKLYSAKRPFENVELSECAEHALEKIVMPEKVRLVKEYEDNCPVSVNKEHLCEVITNLIYNAIDALTEKNAKNAAIRISVGREEDYTYFIIRDNGIGISKQNLKKIFRPFFSTKTTSKNSGIGLYYTEDILKNFGGSITVKSRVGEYTEFQITLPIYHEYKEDLMKKRMFCGLRVR